ncbi:MAG TPA: GNAT family N-acetyltransferase [Thermoanaerobaculia bacterium]
MKREIEIYHLEMTSPAELRPSKAPAAFRVERACIPAPELNRLLYIIVGGDWHWIDRLGWSYEQWLAWVERPELETWLGYLEGTPAGYFELERRPGGDVELAVFGLLPGFLGQGIGGALLTAAVERAWERGGKRVGVNTCSLDAPAALRNYEARGFRRFKTERIEKDFPEEPPGPWPGARVYHLSRP